MKETTTCYVQPFTVPKEIPAGRVLVHNHVKHTTRTRSSVRGFRAWTQKLSDRLAPCKCGWSGLPHYIVGHADTKEHGND